MYGIEHFELAEKLLEGIVRGADLPAAEVAVVAALAQVHATLALAAPAYALHRPPARGPAPKPETLAANPENHPSRPDHGACLLFDCGLPWAHPASAHDA